MEVLDIAALEAPRFTAVHGLLERLELVFDPGLPPVTREELRRLGTDDRTEFGRHVRVAAFADGEPVSVGHLDLTRDPANASFCSAEILGVDHTAGARAVLADLVARAEDDGRATMLGWGELSPVVTTFWTGVGMTQRYVERLSHLDVAAVDRELMQAWIDAGEDGAADVAIVAWQGACPDGHLDAFVAARNAMNDAPTDDIDVADSVITPELVREDEDALAAVGLQPWVLLAVDPDGGAAGMTSIHVNTFRPGASWQWDTVVLAHQRRRGIGRWLKAAMWRWLRDDRPDVTTLQTGNAETNDAMLAINEAMGFRPAHTMAGWQADLQVVRTHLAADGAVIDGA